MTVLSKRRNLDQNKTAYAKADAIKTSPQKIGLVADLIKGLKVSDAFLQLRFSRKKVAKDVQCLLNSAVANAENNHNLNVDNLVISEILVGKAFTMKRLHARGRGKAARIFKPFTRMTIFVTERGV